MKRFKEILKDSKIGDLVWNAASGNCAIVKIYDNSSEEYPVIVETPTGLESFTFSGLKNELDRKPTLFKSDPGIKYEYDELEIDWSKVPRNTKTIVSMQKNGKECERYFSDYLKRPGLKYQCYDGGEERDRATSISCWRNCRIHPSVEIKDEWLVKNET